MTFTAKKSKKLNTKRTDFLPTLRPRRLVTNFLVAMATNDKHCQTLSVKSDSFSEITRDCDEFAQVMYDETVSVVNAKEIDSPESNSDGEEPVKAAMSKFNPPVRHTARHDFDSESESESDPEKFLATSGEDQSPERKSLENVGKVPKLQKQVSKETTHPGRTRPPLKRGDSSNSGLTVLDEPAAEQSDSALLHLQLRAISKTSSAKSTVLTKKIENAEQNSKAIERWIKDVSELHLSKPAPTVNYNRKMPDIDSLMEEWPESMEDTLNEVGFPPANIDCSLSQYVDLVCGLFDIPIAGDTLNDRIQALHLLFSLYSAVKNSQLYQERQKEAKEVDNKI